MVNMLNLPNLRQHLTTLLGLLLAMSCSFAIFATGSPVVVLENTQNETPVSSKSGSITGTLLSVELMRYVALYNHQLPQAGLKSKTPMGIMTYWHASHPHLFVKRPYDHPGCDT
jgi:hypothetical protein